MKEHAIGFEAVLVSMSKTKDGTKLVLVVHPSDNANELFSHPIGTRYQVGAVRLDDEDKPIHRTEGQRAVMDAGMLCRNREFAESIGVTCEEDATDYIHRACGIRSRSELATNVKALAKFHDIRDRFLSKSWSANE